MAEVLQPGVWCANLTGAALRTSEATVKDQADVLREIADEVTQAPAAQETELIDAANLLIDQPRPLAAELSEPGSTLMRIETARKPGRTHVPCRSILLRSFRTATIDGPRIGMRSRRVLTKGDSAARRHRHLRYSPGVSNQPLIRISAR